jgi:hypothetical protein
MNIYNLIVQSLLLILLCSSVSLFANITATVQKPWNSATSNFVYTVGFLKHSTIDWQYYEIGVVLMPNIESEGSSLIEGPKFQKKYDHSFYGAYGGYYITLFPIFRPGFLFGTIMKKNEIYSSIDGINYHITSYSDFNLDYYAAFSIQSGIFSFVLSNKGIGGGINVQF